MSSSSKSKGRKTVKEEPKLSAKPQKHVNTSVGISTSRYDPLSRTLEDSAPAPSVALLQTCGQSKSIAKTDDVPKKSGLSGESEEHNEKRENNRLKNEKKHDRQKERRAQELHEKCCSYLTSRKLETLAQQLVSMGFPLEGATMALIMNEGKLEESVAWLFDGGEDLYKHKRHDLKGGGELEIDISEELARVADIEIRYRCSKQEVERALVASEGDFVKAEEALRSRLGEPVVPTKAEEAGDTPTSSSNTKLPTELASSPALPQKRDVNLSNHMKVTASATSSRDPGHKAAQPLNIVQPAVLADKRFPASVQKTHSPRLSVVGPNMSSSRLSVASPKLPSSRFPSAGPKPSASSSLQTYSQPMKTEHRNEVAGNEPKNPQLRSFGAQVKIMQRPKPIAAQERPNHVLGKSSPLSPPMIATQERPNHVFSNSGLLESHATTQDYNLWSTANRGLLESLGSDQGNTMWNIANDVFLESHQTNQEYSLWNSTNIGFLESQRTNELNNLPRNSTNHPQHESLAEALLGPPSSSVDYSKLAIPGCNYYGVDWSTKHMPIPPPFESGFMGPSGGEAPGRCPLS